MATTKYQRLLKAQSGYCAGKTKKTTVTKAKKAYVDDAIKKGKTRAEALKIAQKVTGKCKAKVSGTKRKTKVSGTKKKTTARR